MGIWAQFCKRSVGEDVKRASDFLYLGENEAVTFIQRLHWLKSAPGAVTLLNVSLVQEKLDVLAYTLSILWGPEKVIRGRVKDACTKNAFNWVEGNSRF